MIALFLSAAIVAAPSSGPMSTCADLAASYDDISKELASIDAEGVGDNSAPREAVRQTRTNSEYLKATMVITLLAQNKCTAPKQLPDSITYAIPAMQCETALLTWPDAKSLPDKCIRAKWSPGPNK